MSELIDKNIAGPGLRWRLLSTVSALTLLASQSIYDAKADQSDAPTVWIELGGQLERQSGQGEPFDPPFVANNLASPAFLPVSLFKSESTPLYSNGAEGQITFQPDESNWVFSASVRYGRSNGRKDVLEQAPEPRLHYIKPVFTGVRYQIRSEYITESKVDFSDAQIETRQSHTVLDFQAGKDVGLGLFGRRANVVFNFGVRFAQFTSSASANIHALLNLQRYNYFTPHKRIQERYPSVEFYLPLARFHTYAAQFRATRSFHGVGPSISVNGSAPFLGEPEKGEISVDWGANAALLFGRQRASGAHQTSGQYFAHFKYHSPYNNTASFSRAKAVSVPNVGGFAGISFLYADAKVSFGYRGDFFFGAMDAGIDARKSETVGFYGPFASISVGLGG